MRIYLDVAHGGDDPGGIGPSGRKEKEYSLQQAQLMRLALLREGHEVKLSRHTDINLVESETAQRANGWGSDIFLALHSNAFSDPSASGAEVLYWNTSSDGRRLADNILDSLAARFPGLIIRGSKPKFPGDRGETVLRKTICTAVILEPQFITAPKGEKFLFDFVNQALISDAVREAIDKEEFDE